MRRHRRVRGKIPLQFSYFANVWPTCTLIDREVTLIKRAGGQTLAADIKRWYKIYITCISRWHSSRARSFNYLATSSSINKLSWIIQRIPRIARYLLLARIKGAVATAVWNSRARAINSQCRGCTFNLKITVITWPLASSPVTSPSRRHAKGFDVRGESKEDGKIRQAVHDLIIERE